MDNRQKTIERIKELEKNQPRFSLDEIQTEIKKRNESPYTEITDYADVPQATARSEAIEAYLASPQFRRLALEILGGVAGAATGGTFLAARLAMRPALGLLYRSLGAGIGEGGAAGLAQTFDPRDDLAKEILRGFATGATAETIGAAVPAIISKIGFKGLKYTPEAERADKLLKNLKEAGIDTKGGIITPGIGGENRFIDIVENISEKSLGGGGRIIKARKGAEGVVTNQVNLFVDSFSDATTRTDAGELALGAVQNSLNFFKSTAKVKYDKLTNAAKGVNVDVTDSKELAKKLLLESKPTKKLSPDAQKVLETVAELDDTVSFSLANNVRSDLLGVSRSTKDLIKGRATVNTAKMIKSITNDIDKTADLLPTNFRKLYDDAQNFYRLGVDKFNNKVIRRLADKAPEEVYKTLIKPKRPTTIQNLFKVINETKDKEIRQELKDSLKGTLIGDIVSESKRLKKGKIDADYITKEFEKYGDDVLKQMFEPGELKTARGLLEALEVAQAKSAGEGLPGPIFIQLTQAGAAIGLLSGGFTTEAGVILLGPAAIARVLTNPKMVNLMKRGIKLNPGSKEAYTNASQIIGAMISNNIISQDEGEDHLDNLKKSMSEKKTYNKLAVPQEPFTLEEGTNIEDLINIETMPTQATSPKVSSIAPITPPLNTGIMQVNTPLSQTGLTSTEQALLSPEEQSIRLRQRGIA